MSHWRKYSSKHFSVHFSVDPISIKNALFVHRFSPFLKHTVVWTLSTPKNEISSTQGTFKVTFSSVLLWLTFEVLCLGSKGGVVRDWTCCTLCYQITVIKLYISVYAQAMGHKNGA